VHIHLYGNTGKQNRNKQEYEYDKMEKVVTVTCMHCVDLEKFARTEMTFKGNLSIGIN